MAPNLFLFTPWMFLHERLAPLLPGMVGLNQQVLRRQINGCLRDIAFGTDKAVAWVFHPYQKDMISVVDADLLVYECYDEYMATAYVTSRQKSAMCAYEDGILNRADVVFATARRLQETRKKKNPNTYLVPNGVDFELFSMEVDSPQGIRHIPSPRIGYSGAINHNLDFDLLDHIALRHKDWSIVFIGPFSWNRLVEQPDSLRRLQQSANVFFLGTKPYHEMPRYLSALDVLIIPFVKNEAMHAVYPLKLNEYLAVGKPVVSTSFSPDLVEFSSVVTLADSI